MKKSLLLVAIAATSALLTACSEDNNEPYNPDDSDDVEVEAGTDSICRADKRVVWFHEEGGSRDVDIKGTHWEIEEVIFFTRSGYGISSQYADSIIPSAVYRPNLSSDKDFLWMGEWLSIKWEDSHLAIEGEAFSESLPIRETAVIVMSSKDERDSIYVARQITTPERLDYFCVGPEKYQVSFNAEGGEEYLRVKFPCHLESIEVDGNYLGERPADFVDYPYIHSSEWVTFSMTDEKGFSVKIKPNTTGESRACKVRLVSDIWWLSVVVGIEQSAE